VSPEGRATGQRRSKCWGRPQATSAGDGRSAASACTRGQDRSGTTVVKKGLQQQRQLRRGVASFFAACSAESKRLQQTREQLRQASSLDQSPTGGSTTFSSNVALRQNEKSATQKLARTAEQPGGGKSPKGEGLQRQGTEPTGLLWVWSRAGTPN